MPESPSLENWTIPWTRLTDSSVTRFPEVPATWLTRRRTSGNGVGLPTAWPSLAEWVRAVAASAVSFSPISRLCSPGAT